MSDNLSTLKDIQSSLIQIWEESLKWLKTKTRIQTQLNRPFYDEGSVWWCNLGYNVGDEENGKGEDFLRPVIVIRKFNKNICLVVPLSTKLKDNKYYYQIEFATITQSALISQIRTIDTKRFIKRKGQLTQNELKLLKEYIKSIVFDD